MLDLHVSVNIYGHGVEFPTEIVPNTIIHWKKGGNLHYGLRSLVLNVEFKVKTVPSAVSGHLRFCDACLSNFFSNLCSRQVLVSI